MLEGSRASQISQDVIGQIWEKTKKSKFFFPSTSNSDEISSSEAEATTKHKQKKNRNILLNKRQLIVSNVMLKLPAFFQVERKSRVLGKCWITFLIQFSFVFWGDYWSNVPSLETVLCVSNLQVFCFDWDICGSNIDGECQNRRHLWKKTARNLKKSKKNMMYILREVTCTCRINKVLLYTKLL